MCALSIFVLNTCFGWKEVRRKQFCSQIMFSMFFEKTNLYAFGNQLLIGVYLGTWICVETKHVVPKPKEKPRRPLRDGPQPADWIRERWEPGEWEIRLDQNRGWSVFPAAAQRQLEDCYQQQRSETILEVGTAYIIVAPPCFVRHLFMCALPNRPREQMGIYGGYRYKIDLNEKTALNLDVDKAVKQLIRRSTQR